MIAVGIDTETAGVEEAAPVLSIGAYWENPAGGPSKGNAFSKVIRPYSTTQATDPCGPLAALAVHGLTPAYVNRVGMAVGQVVHAFGGFLPDFDDYFFVAHNAKFDADKMKWLYHFIFEDEPESMFEPGALWHRAYAAMMAPWVDTLRLAQKVLDEATLTRLGNLKLDTLYLWHLEQRGTSLEDGVAWLRENRAHHDAHVDARMALELFRDTLSKMIPGNIRKLPDLVEWLDRPMVIKNWTFGKHKGESIADNRGFAEWLCKQPWAQTDRPDDWYSAMLSLGKRVEL